MNCRRLTLNSQRQILDCSKLKEFASDDKFQLDENGGKFCKWLENSAGKGEICSLQAISPLTNVLSKDIKYRHLKTRACMGKGEITEIQLIQHKTPNKQDFRKL